MSPSSSGGGGGGGVGGGAAVDGVDRVRGGGGGGGSSGKSAAAQEALRSRNNVKRMLSRMSSLSASQPLPGNKFKSATIGGSRLKASSGTSDDSGSGAHTRPPTRRNSDGSHALMMAMEDGDDDSSHMYSFALGD